MILFYNFTGRTVLFTFIISKTLTTDNNNHIIILYNNA